MSTLTVLAQVPSVAEDCELLRKAFAGWGTNEELIISILAHRNAAQRKAIRQTYAQTYEEDLLKALDKELTNDFERLVMLWTLDPVERDAYLVNEATKRWTSSNQVLVEIACAKSPHDLLLAREAYHARFKKSLEEDVAHHTTGDFRKCDASTRASHISPSPTLYDYAENFTMEEVFAMNDSLKELIKSTSEAHNHVIVAKASEKVVTYSRPRMRFACEQSGKHKKFAKKSDGVDRVVKKRVRTTGVKEISVPL